MLPLRVLRALLREPLVSGSLEPPLNFKAHGQVISISSWKVKMATRKTSKGKPKNRSSLTRRTAVLEGLRPSRYYRGLTRKAQQQRAKEIQRFGAKDTSDPSAYVGFKTDVGVKTKPSSYTESWNKLFPEAKSLEERAKVTGVPKRFLQESFDRGMAAWRTGHRPGATQQQWGYARVSSFLLCGKTHYSTDSDLVRKAVKASALARKWFSRCR